MSLQSSVSIYKYDTVVRELEYCKDKLRRDKITINALTASVARLRKIVAEERPTALSPGKILKHAARHLRAVEGQSFSVNMLFRLAGKIDEERCAPYQREAMAKYRERVR